MFRTVKDYQMPAPSPDSVAGSEGRRLISRRSINDRFRRKLPIPAAEMSERSWQRCPPSWQGTDPLLGL
jgi:hypothetical protein